MNSTSLSEIVHVAKKHRWPLNLTMVWIFSCKNGLGVNDFTSTDAFHKNSFLKGSIK